MSHPHADLAKIRHDLRTPINHILGYCEILLEEEGLPERFNTDLQSVRASGRKLLDLINQHLGDDTFSQDQNLQQLQHELRTPVNHILGYTELLTELSQEAGLERLIPDLDKVRQGATRWLTLMEEYLIPAACPDDKKSNDATRPAGAVKPVSTVYPFPAGLSSSVAQLPAWNAKLLAVDDDPGNVQLLTRTLSPYGARVTTAGNGLEALAILEKEPHDLVLLDLMMPELDGYQVLLRIKADPRLRHIPVIMVSGMDQESGIARCLEAGAEDFLSKPFNPVFLRARIGASLEKKRWHDQEQAIYEALRRSQQRLAAELAEAGNYVRSLLPPVETGRISTRWAFESSAELGGDAFGHHWLDANRLVVYLLDVCGHGVGAALLSVSVLNVLRAQSIPEVDFSDPASVLAGLNRIFSMERQNQMYFTMWYGVWDLAKGELAYSSAGHPPALLCAPDSAHELRTPGPPVGSLPEAVYRTAQVEAPTRSRLIVYSDGVYEIPNAAGRTQTLREFLDILKAQVGANTFEPREWLTKLQAGSNNGVLEDDFSLIEIVPN